MKRFISFLAILLLCISTCYDEREIMLMNDSIESIGELNISFVIKGVLRKIYCKYDNIVEELSDSFNDLNGFNEGNESISIFTHFNIQYNNIYCVIQFYSTYSKCLEIFIVYS